MMHIIHISTENVWRGGEQQIAYLIEELALKRINSVVLCRKESAFHQYCIEKNIVYFTFNGSSGINFRAAFQLIKINKKISDSIVHAHSSKGLTLALIASILGLTAKIVYTKRVDFPLKKSFFTRWKYNTRRLSHIICISHAIKNTLVSYLNNPEKNMSVIYSGIDLKRFEKSNLKSLREKFNISDEDIIIGSVAALDDSKDPWTVIHAAEILFSRNYHFRFVLIGNGPLKNDIQSYLESKNLTDKICIAGYLDKAYEYISDMDVFLLVSKREGLGTSILDSFASRTPVIGTQTGGIPELVLHQKTGLIIPVSNPEKLANSIEKLINEKELRTAITKVAHDYVHEFSKEVMTSKTIDVYHQILNS